jgi:hypothetical protein
MIKGIMAKDKFEHGVDAFHDLVDLCCSCVTCCSLGHVCYPHYEDLHMLLRRYLPYDEYNDWEIINLNLEKLE